MKNKNLKYNNFIKYKKHLTVCGMLVVLILVIIFIMTRSTDDEHLTEEKVQRIDITHTYYQLADGIYRIYPGDISYLKEDQGELRIEYLETQLYGGDTLMQEDARYYHEKSSSTRIIHLPLSKEFEVNIGTNVSDEKNIEDMELLRTEWSAIRAICGESPDRTSSYILSFEVSDLEIKNISIDDFDVQNQE